MDREEDLQDYLPKLMPVCWLRDLIHVVPKVGAGDRSSKYCIKNLPTDTFTELLHRQQRTYPNLCWMSVLSKPHTSVALYNNWRITGIIWDCFKAILSRTHAMLVTLLLSSIDSGHDCGTFVMAFMDLLSLKADGLELDQACVAHSRDKCLFSFLQGRNNSCHIREVTALLWVQYTSSTSPKTQGTG
ncbi:hypothetical protein Cgig2_032847 [Carnegiea gigantea]|uniref:Ubiquitin-like protease family profile domain-containing protein n=1 Tax=Carnegiea gigantea TaxID=171969 RepID=A0A9Q1JNV0_9CARY|nr:hypothetical protein Cgig2_032847 [Carnegiea gigantea]